MASKTENPPAAPSAQKNDPKKKKDEKKEEELSEEDMKLKQELELLVERAQDREPGVQKLALDSLCKEIKSATSSMTSVPKPLKFLRPHYNPLKTFYNGMPESDNKKYLADVLSVLAMTMGDDISRDCLNFKLKGTQGDVGAWGHEYIRHLSDEIIQEYTARQTDGKGIDDLQGLVDQIVPFDMKHNAEPDACDLLCEVERIPAIIDFVDENNYERVCLYLFNTANYVAEPEDAEILRTTCKIYQKVKKYTDALRVAMRLNDTELVKELFETCDDVLIKKQLAFMAARQRIIVEQSDSNLNDILNNTNMSENFLTLARNLDITEAKTPEDIYKSNLDNRTASFANVDSARQNLASTFVNAFVNAGFLSDKLMTEEGSKWIYKNKDHGMMSAAASLGMILMWDVEGGLSQIDKYLYFNEDNIKAGALLAVGIVNCGVRNECDPALALLTEHVESPSLILKIGSTLGLGLAYAGSARQDVADLLTPIVEDSTGSMEAASLAALALGLIFVGTSNPDITQTIIQALLERDQASLTSTYARFMCLGLGLLYMGKGESADVTLEMLKAVQGPMKEYCTLTVEGLAYAGTGNVLRIQKLLNVCIEHFEKDQPSGHQAVAVLGLALVAMAEDIGSEMCVRTMDHLLQYGEPVIRRAVPLALGLLSVSNPRITVMDTLSKLSHDSDAEVAQSAIFSLGLIGAGTNNSRIAGLLRNLASYYYKDPNNLFMVRIGQALLHCGKGTMSLSPFHSDRMLLSPVAVAGLISVLHAGLDIKNIILGKSHYLLYLLSLAMKPRMLMTFDENLKPVEALVRVGQAVDVVGQAGKPKTITGFQTHTTPVLLGYGERAELATDEFLPVTNVLEGFVILKKNPNATEKKPEKEKEKSK